MQSKNFMSLTVQTIYVVLIGLQLIFVPNMVLNLFGIEPTTEIWIKVLGIVVMSLAFIYRTVGQKGDADTVRATVWARLVVCAGFVLLVLTKQAQTALIFFAGIDLATSVWTWFELKKSLN